MTTRPYLVAFAACVAGLIATGLPLVATVLGADTLAFLLWGGGLGLFMFAGVMAFGLNEGAQVWLRQKDADLKRDQLANADREQTLAERIAAAFVATDDDEPDPEPTRRAAWKAALIRLFTAGDALGSFSQPKLKAARVVPSSDYWQALTDWFCEQPAADPVLRRTPGGTNWNFHWSLEKALLALATDDLPLPPGPPPTINAYVAEKRSKDSPEKGSGVVVEGVARQVGE